MDPFPPKKDGRFLGFKESSFGETVCKKWGGNRHLPKIIWFWPFKTVSPFAGHAPFLPGTPLKVAQIFKVRKGEKWHHGWILDDLNWSKLSVKPWRSLQKRWSLFGGDGILSIFIYFLLRGRTGIQFFSRFKLAVATAGFTLFFFVSISFAMKAEKAKGGPFCGHGWSPVVFARGEQVNMQKTPSVIPYTLSLNLWV